MLILIQISLGQYYEYYTSCDPYETTYIRPTTKQVSYVFNDKIWSIKMIVDRETKGDNDTDIMRVVTILCRWTPSNPRDLVAPWPLGLNYKTQQASYLIIIGNIVVKNDNVKWDKQSWCNALIGWIQTHITEEQWQVSSVTLSLLTSSYRIGDAHVKFIRLFENTKR